MGGCCVVCLCFYVGVCSSGLDGGGVVRVTGVSRPPPPPPVLVVDPFLTDQFAPLRSHYSFTIGNRLCDDSDETLNPEPLDGAGVFW
jgi:hypothetical protein